MYVCFTEESMAEKQNDVNKFTRLWSLLNYIIFQKYETVEKLIY